MTAGCPCGSGAPYIACCGPLHAGEARAVTALQLMRSRYSAFVLSDAGYLLATWDPATRPPALELDPALEWRRLKIRGVSGGGDSDETGTVEFIAHYWDATQRQYGRHQETSRFVRRGDTWFFTDAAA